MIRLPHTAMLILIAAAAALSPLPVRASADVTITEIKPKLPTIPDKTFTLTDFGATPDGKTLNTDAFTKAISEIDKAGGGKLIVPKGTFRTLPFALCSSLDLHLEEGAVIQAPDNFKDYGFPDPATLKTQAEATAQIKIPEPLLHGTNLHDVAITGTGSIDGSGAIWWAWSERAARAQTGRVILPRQKMVVINGCQRLHIADITLTNSPMFHLVPRDVTDLLVERVKVRAPFNAPNTDAMDPANCVNALFTGCDIDVGDDDIVIKSGGHEILIENCTIKHGHGISIGSGTTDGIHNMLVRNCTFDGSDNGIRIKSMRGAGGLVENVRYTNIQMKNVTNAIILDLTYTDSNRPNFVGDPNKIPKIQHIELDNIQITGSKNAGKIIGLPDSKITDITLKNIQIAADKDFVITDAENPILENVQKAIKPGTAPPRGVVTPLPPAQ